MWSHLDTSVFWCKLPLEHRTPLWPTLVRPQRPKSPLGTCLGTLPICSVLMTRLLKAHPIRQPLLRHLVPHLHPVAPLVPLPPPTRVRSMTWMTAYAWHWGLHPDLLLLPLCPLPPLWAWDNTLFLSTAPLPSQRCPCQVNSTDVINGCFYCLLYCIFHFFCRLRSTYFRIVCYFHNSFFCEINIFPRIVVCNYDRLPNNKYRSWNNIHLFHEVFYRAAHKELSIALVFQLRLVLFIGMFFFFMANLSVQMQL